MCLQKKLIFIIPFFLLISCGDKEQKKSAEAADVSPTTTTTSDSASLPKLEENAAASSNNASDASPASSEPTSTTSANTAASIKAHPTADNKDGLDLARRSGCLACHAIDKKVVGPPWMAVSQRYKSTAQIRQRLIDKVKSGGRGGWTEVVGNAAMPPYSPRVSDENIGKLIDFILGLAP